jgi:hypothetical protein
MEKWNREVTYHLKIMFPLFQYSNIPYDISKRLVYYDTYFSTSPLNKYRIAIRTATPLVT